MIFAILDQAHQSRIFKHLKSPGIDSPANVARARTCKRLWRPGIDSEESILSAYVAWRAGTTNRVVVLARQAGNRFLGSLKALQIRALAGWYDTSICPTGPPAELIPWNRFLGSLKVYKLGLRACILNVYGALESSKRNRFRQTM
jgi:hypothetical protein